jgi:hypothetical protein
LKAPVFRRSQIVCPRADGTSWFQFQAETTILEEWSKTGTISQLVGFEKSWDSGTDCLFNFILSNGARSTQRDEDVPTKYDHMIPADALHKIRSVTIHHNNNCIGGFSFFDKVRALLWMIGEIYSDDEVETVLLAENEVIAGVIAKLLSGCQSAYTDF